ncbi:endonuclease/exonuclease/phosphatase family protein [Microvirga sp. BT689]|uniref:Calx-beta domain-containing protein n=1 Tax=Microvirga arvi TaxID=2778731 RepID=UPI0019507859|nr:Calx-beta domain-containing protein [Microvirga arvi]MBM6579138.1 endonuclease/exonuclease/phosphatase family protein [Microvirga arvi]
MANVWINEFHYDNAGTDTGEFIEIAGLAGTDLTGWKIIAFNGNGGAAYATLNLTGVIGNATGTGHGFFSFTAAQFTPASGTTPVTFQNGNTAGTEPDGFALVDNNGNVVEFISYEGVISTTYNNQSITSTNITNGTGTGVFEDGTGAVGGSIQRQGTGDSSEDFTTWAVFNTADTATAGNINAGQTFTSPDPTLSIAATSADKAEGSDGTTTEFTFTVTRSSTTGSPTATWTLDPGQASLNDFVGPLTGTVTFADGSPTATITIQVAADAEFEQDETFSVTLSDPVGATIPDGSATATGQIDNDDTTTDEILSISATPIVQNEGKAPDFTIYTFTVTRENGDGTTEFTWSIRGLGDNGLTPEDFLETTDKVTFAEGQTEAVVQIRVRGDARFEADEPFEVRISTEKADVQIQNDTASGTITNDDLQQSFSIAATSAVKAEGDSGETVFTFTVTRANSTGEAATIDFDLSGLGGAGRATSDDFVDADGGTIQFAAGETTKTIEIRVRGDTTIEQNEAFSATLSNPSEGVLGTATAGGQIVNDDFHRIYEIQTQNPNRESVLNGQTVTTTGIITGIQMTGTTRGFYIQDVTGDGNAATSDGIFVFMGSNWTPSFEVGDEVAVNGRVDENFGLTRIDGGTTSRAATVTLIDKGNALPEAIVIGPNGIKPPTTSVAEAIDFYEALEGMRVTIEPTRVVGATNNFGEIYTVIEGAYDPSSLNDRGGLSIAPGDFNPERIQFDNIRDSLNMPMLDVGARRDSITGIMSYGFSTYEVLIGTSPKVTAQSTLQAEVTNVRASNEFFLSFANYNVENLDINDDDGDADVDGGQFAKLADQIVKNMGSPHVIALQELQDDSGTVDNGILSADITLQKLVDEIVKAGGPRYKFAYLNPEDGKDGGADGGNIRQAFLYNDDVVDLVPGSLERIIDPDPAVNDAFNASRKPLVAKFIFNGEEYTFINNHLNSKNGDGAIFGTTQPPALGSQAQRIEQTKLINAYVDDLLADDANANIVVLGDMNDFSWSDPLKTLDGTFGGGQQVLWNMADEFIANPADRTDYVFEGNSQSLDHIYVSAAMRARMEALDILRINSEFDIEQRASDHDALVARSTFKITRAAAGNSTVVGDDGSNALLGNGGNNVMNGGAGRDYLQGDAGSDLLIGGLGADGLFGGDGIDWVSYEGASTAVRANLAAPGGNTGEAAGDTYGSIENLLGSRFADALFGNAGTNVIDGGLGADVMNGGAGDDALIVDNAADVAIGGSGSDTVATSINFALGGDVENLIATGAAALQLKGNGLANAITGNAAANKIHGGLGNDLLRGGSGKDVFVFDTKLNKSTNVDRVYDFKSSDDSFYLDNAVFTKLGPGSASRPKKFTSDMFVTGTKAQDREDRIIYDKKTGNLYYDADGTGKIGQVKIATIVNKTTLKFDDFFVI